MTLFWTLPPGDPSARVLVQMRAAGAPGWQSPTGWLDPGATEARLEGLGTATVEIRLRAMDAQGNRATEWSTTLEVTP